jgi:hypothetical protein
MPLVLGFCDSTFLSSARHVRGPGAGVDVGAAASDFTFIKGCRLWPLGSQGRWPSRDAILGPVSVLQRFGGWSGGSRIGGPGFECCL